jgi:hypothetical protein
MADVHGPCSCALLAQWKQMGTLRRAAKQPPHPCGAIVSGEASCRRGGAASSTPLVPATCGHISHRALLSTCILRVLDPGIFHLRIAPAYF